MSTQIKKNGNWVTVAGGTRMWVGTKAALQAALDAGELVDGTAVMVTDDYEDANAVVNVTGYSTPGITSGNVTVKRAGHTVIVTFDAVDTDVTVSAITGLPKPVSPTFSVVHDPYLALQPAFAYLTENGAINFSTNAKNGSFYGQLVYFTND